MKTRTAEEILYSLGLRESTPSLNVQLRLFRRLNAEAEIERAPEISDECRQDWWNTPIGRWRLEVEDLAMRERFPGFELELLEETCIAWTGSLQSALPGGECYVVYVVYGVVFPDLPPNVVIVEPQLVEGTPHLLRGQEPCLYNHAGRARGYDPASTTAATLVAWTALWIHAYEAWRRTERWPGRGE